MGQARQRARERTRNAEAESSSEDDNEDAEDGLNGADHEASQDILGPSFVEATNKNSWIRGQFPAPRSAVAVATASEKSVDDSKHFYLFGGSEYVHQVWYSDLYRCTVQSPSLRIGRPSASASTCDHFRDQGCQS